MKAVSSKSKKINKDNIPEFIYLIPGNWFELKNMIPERLQPYDSDMLKEEILNQVNNRAEKLDVFNTKFCRMYQNAEVESITFHLDKNKFDQIAKILTKERRHPIITFHGTKPDVIDSILKNGYIMPGDKTSPTKISVAHGSMYGTGIYSSSFFDKASCYTVADANAYVYILINILFPGKAILIPPHTMTNITLSQPTNGRYPDGTNTRIVYGLDQVISADPARIVPVGVMKIKAFNKV